METRDEYRERKLGHLVAWREGVGVYVNIGWDEPGKRLAEKEDLPLRHSYLTPLGMGAVVRSPGAEPTLVPLLG